MMARNKSREIARDSFVFPMAHAQTEVFKLKTGAIGRAVSTGYQQGEG